MRRLASVLCVGAAVLFSACVTNAAALIDFEVHLVPQKDFSKYIPGYVEGNIGFFCLQWNGNCECTHAIALIACDVTQAERRHAIREEITQALGLMRDSSTYTDSIYYQDWTPGLEYAPIDKTLIRMLHRPEIVPGMTRQQADAVLKDRFSKAEINYFNEIAFGSEYVQGSEVIHKWLHDPVLSISGQMSQTDIETVKQVVKDLNELVGRIQLKIVKWTITPAPNT